MYGSTEELWFPDWEYKGTPWTNAGDVRRSTSPRNAAKNFKTPTLVIHGELDYRLDVSEGAPAVHRAAATMGVASEAAPLPGRRTTGC